MSISRTAKGSIIGNRRLFRSPGLMRSFVRQARGRRAIDEINSHDDSLDPKSLGDVGIVEHQMGSFNDDSVHDLC
jgi:hypothetical protein